MHKIAAAEEIDILAFGRMGACVTLKITLKIKRKVLLSLSIKLMHIKKGCDKSTKNLLLIASIQQS